MGVEYTIRVINAGDISLLDQFIHSAGSSLHYFRYFNNRPFSVLGNHLVTCVLMNGNRPAGYGHLDKDEDTIWLGIAIAEEFRGKRLGKLIMEYLLFTAKTNRISKVNLAVDRENISAIRLYEEFGFVTLRNLNEHSLLMELNISYG